MKSILTDCCCGAGILRGPGVRSGDADPLKVLFEQSTRMAVFKHGTQFASPLSVQPE